MANPSPRKKLERGSGRGREGGFEGPVVAAVGVAVAVGGEEAAAMGPEPGPDLFAIGLGDVQAGQGGAGEKREPALGMVRGQSGQAGLDFKQKHEPMGLTLIAVLADEAGEMEVGGSDGQAGFLAGFPAGAGIGGFALVEFELAAEGAPKAAIRLLGALQQEDVVALVKGVNQGGDFVGQNHGGSWKADGKKSSAKRGGGRLGHAQPDRRKGRNNFHCQGAATI